MERIYLERWRPVLGQLPAALRGRPPATEREDKDSLADDFRVAKAVELRLAGLTVYIPANSLAHSIPGGGHFIRNVRLNRPDGPSVVVTFAEGDDRAVKVTTFTEAEGTIRRRRGVRPQLIDA